MDNLFIQESWTNATENCSYGESEVYESFTDKRGDLFRSLQKQFGRCVSLVMIDTADGIKTIGWTFQKRLKYTDCDKYYLAETWITIHEKPPTKTIEYHYAN